MIKTNNTQLYISSTGLGITGDVYIINKSILRVLDINALGAIFSDSLTIDTILPSGNTLHLKGHVAFRDTNNNLAITVQPALGIGILKTLVLKKQRHHK